MDNPETNRKDKYVACLAETDDCPACREDGGREGSYVMYLTVIDLSPYTTRKGKTVPYNQKLFVVKSRQQGKFTRKFDALTNSRGLRGLKVKLFRDDERSPVIGNDIEFTGKRVSEDALERYIDSYTDRKGKTHTKKLGEVLDYETLFPAVTKEELISQLGGSYSPTPGSDAEAEKVDEGEWDKNPDETPWEETKKPARRKVVKKGARRLRRKPA